MFGPDRLVGMPVPGDDHGRETVPFGSTDRSRDKSPMAQVNTVEGPYRDRRSLFGWGQVLKSYERLQDPPPTRTRSGTRESSFRR